MDELIERLTENGKYANEICLLLLVNDNYTSLHYLDYLGITGKELENLEKCCDDSSIDYLTQTIRFLRSGFLGKDEIKANLNSPNPVYFIDRLLRKGEDWDYAYEHYASTFRSKMNTNKR